MPAKPDAVVLKVVKPVATLVTVPVKVALLARWMVYVLAPVTAFQDRPTLVLATVPIVGAAETAARSTPVPLNATVWVVLCRPTVAGAIGTTPELSTIDRVPLLSPAVVGANATVIVQF